VKDVSESVTNSSSSLRLEGFKVQLVFEIAQHGRDEELMRSLVDYLGCGNVYKNREAVDLKITKFNDLTDKVLPLFKQYPILGVKSKDFKDFCKVVELMQNKAQLTPEGLEQIRKIKAGMNIERPAPHKTVKEIYHIYLDTFCVGMVCRSILKPSLFICMINLMALLHRKDNELLERRKTYFGA